MRKEYEKTKTNTKFPIGSIVKCIVGGKHPNLHPCLGELYKVVDCYFYLHEGFIDIRSMDDTYEGGVGIVPALN